MFHYRKTRKSYENLPNEKDRCCFCDPEIAKRDGAVETKYFLVVPSGVPYNFWEMHEVTEHLLVIPKRHVDSLSKLTADEKLEALDLFGRYEARDYNVYARAAQSEVRTVKHQHTHLIKIGGKEARTSVYVRKPYLLLKF